jgi:lysophospholipase L1-like esterase
MNNNYIIIGDSLTYGIGDFETGGWSTMFKNYIVNKDDSKVCNNYVYVAAFPGATSTVILNKLDNIYQSFKNDEFNNVVILSIGVNDTQEFNGSLKTSLEDYEKNINKIIDYVNNQQAKLIIFGLGRIQSDDKFYWKPGKFYCNETLDRYDEVLERVCNEKKIEYVSMKDVLAKEDYVDGLHPNKIGHEKIFMRAKEFIK